MADHYFFRLGSGRSDTNIQVFAFYKASETWSDVLEGKYGDDVVAACTFVVTMLGTSVSQLLGQNPVKPSKRPDRVDDPRSLFGDFTKEYDLDAELAADFEWFMEWYDSVRHFGIVPDGSRHVKLEGLTRDVTARCYTIARRVWDVVLAVHRQELGAKIADLDLDDLWILSAAAYAEEDPGPDAGVDE